MKFKSFLALACLLPMTAFGASKENYKRFECRIGPPHSSGNVGERHVRMNISGTLYEKSAAKNLYLLHNVGGSFIWDLFHEETKREGRIVPSSAWASDYMPPVGLVENNVNYRPRRYLNTMQFDLPLGFGDFKFMMPYKATKPGRNRFKSFMIASWVSDHDGASLTLDCESYDSFVPPSDHFLDYTDDTKLGEKALQMRDSFRKSVPHFTRVKVLQTPSTWTCAKVSLDRSSYGRPLKTTVTENQTLKIDPKKEYRYDPNLITSLELSGFLNGTLSPYTGSLEENSDSSEESKNYLSVRRSKVKDGKVKLYIEEYKKAPAGESPFGKYETFYSVSSMGSGVVSYSECVLKSAE